jgi:uncharacterized protein YbjT (DUF2867 family)
MYVILGATGNVGSKVTDILLQKGEKVRAVARSADRLRTLVRRGAEAMAGDGLNAEFLAQALKGASAVFTLIPPNLRPTDFLAYADAMGESIVAAIRKAGVAHVVNLSSIGAELSEGTGPIVGLHRQEKRLNAVPGLNVLHLRSAYFMENLLMNIDLIRSRGIAGSAIRGDGLFPMIATKDIAASVADHLVKRDFTGSSVKYLLGQRDLSLIEATAVIGKKIGKPGLSYVMFPYDEAEKGLVAAGLSADMSRRYIEMSRAFNEGRVGAGLVRTPESTTPTSIEEFADVFAALYRDAKAA